MSTHCLKYPESNNAFRDCKKKVGLNISTGGRFPSTNYAVSGSKIKRDHNKSTGDKSVVITNLIPRRQNSIALVQNNIPARSGTVTLNPIRVAKLLTYLNSNDTTLMNKYHSKGIIIKYKLKKIKNKI